MVLRYTAPFINVYEKGYRRPVVRVPPKGNRGSEAVCVSFYSLIYTKDKEGPKVGPCGTLAYGICTLYGKLPLNQLAKRRRSFQVISQNRQWRISTTDSNCKLKIVMDFSEVCWKKKNSQ